MAHGDRSAGAGVAILGGGSLGGALAEGLLASGSVAPAELTVTRRRPDRLEALAARGVRTTADNRAAVAGARLVLLTVEPHHLLEVLEGVAPALEAGRHVLVSCATGVGIDDLAARVPEGVPVVLAMPNTAVAVRASMTCLATRCDDPAVREEVRSVFAGVGETAFVPEELIPAATVLAACGVAYALRFVRAATQGGIEIGFDAGLAGRIAAQTTYGAARLLLERGLHPEREIDRVTTPRGCTIAGLNEMEHRGFSSALIKGITTSWGKIGRIAEET